jgi:hypothetical protein
VELGQKRVRLNPDTKIDDGAASENDMSKEREILLGIKAVLNKNVM